MADENQTGLMQKIVQLCIKNNLSSIAISENSEKLFSSIFLNFLLSVFNSVGKLLTDLSKSEKRSNIRSSL